MNKGTAIGLGVVGVGAAAALAWYLYNKNNAVQVTETTTTTAPQQLAPTASTSSSTPAASSGIVWSPTMTMYKDKDGNIFKIKTTEYGKWGYVIEINGSTKSRMSYNKQSGTTNLEVIYVGADGLVYGADNNGSFHVWKNGIWQQTLFRDNKSGLSAYLQKLGIPYGTDGRVKLNGLSGLRGLRGLSGVGNGYALN